MTARSTHLVLVDYGTAGCGYRGTARMGRSVDFLGKSTFDLVKSAAIDPNRPP
jgi:hypothetical protein